MTGPGEGKFLIDAEVYLNADKIYAEVYIHLKGYSYARVTHLDIESEKLNLLRPKSGIFTNIHGIKDGLRLTVANQTVEVRCKLLNSVLKENERTRTWVGGKINGIYIGFRKFHIEKLENLCGLLRG
jgi:hypothetical protein